MNQEEAWRKLLKETDPEYEKVEKNIHVALDGVLNFLKETLQVAC